MGRWKLASWFWILTGLIGGVASPAQADGQRDAHILIGWNDLGMHCMNQNFQHLCVLPPANTVWSQVVLQGGPGVLPELVSDGVEIGYSIQENSYSVGKTDFWDWEDQLFGVNLPPNEGLFGAGMTGYLEPHDHGWVVEGIPLTPYLDGDWTTAVPFQLADLELREPGGALLDASTIVAPVAVEMHCDLCHNGPQGPEVAVLQEHEEGLINQQPVLCADCHASNALGMPGNPELPSLSLAIHEQHREIQPGGLVCYACHPGAETQCLRGVHQHREGMDCTSCHGTMEELFQSLEDGREPWLEEPSCGDCHSAGHAPEPGKLFRNSRGHGGMYCEACHGSPHAILPSREERDNRQSIRLQGEAGPLRDCTVCHNHVPSGPGPHGFIPPATPTPSGPIVPATGPVGLMLLCLGIGIALSRIGRPGHRWESRS